MVKTLNLRKIETLSPEIQAFTQALEEAFLKYLNTFVPALQQEKESLQLRDTVESIASCLEYDTAPADAMECFSAGAFKEAYHASDSIVVKFCSCDNPTDREINLLEEATAAGLESLFVPTIFFPLPATLIATQVEDSSSDRWYYNSKYHTYVEHEDCDEYCLNYLEIQPLVIPASHRECAYISYHDNLPPLVCGDGTEIPATMMRRIPTSNLSWLQAVAAIYGYETFEDFAIFCDDWHIWDLHNDNIGWMRKGEVDCPIILDWMSN